MVNTDNTCKWSLLSLLSSYWSISSLLSSNWSILLLLSSDDDRSIFSILSSDWSILLILSSDWSGRADAEDVRGHGQPDLRLLDLPDIRDHDGLPPDRGQCDDVPPGLQAQHHGHHIQGKRPMLHFRPDPNEPIMFGTDHDIFFRGRRLTACSGTTARGTACDWSMQIT